MADHEKGYVGLLNQCIVDTLPTYSQTSNGDEYLEFCVKRQGIKYIIRSFDDERKNNPFKWIQKMTEKQALKKGSVLELVVEVSHYKKWIIPQDKWRMLSNEPNPTLTYLDQYKLTKVDWAVPYEAYEMAKKEGTNEEGIKNDFVPDETDTLGNGIKPIDLGDDW